MRFLAEVERDAIEFFFFLEVEEEVDLIIGVSFRGWDFLFLFLLLGVGGVVSVSSSSSSSEGLGERRGDLLGGEGVKGSELMRSLGFLTEWVDARWRKV